VIRITQRQEQVQELKQIPQIKLANFLDLKETEFAGLIKEVEENPLFRQLWGKAIYYKKHASADFYFLPLKEEILSGSPSLTGGLFKKKKEMDLARKIGLEKFEEYFLFPERSLAFEEIAVRCGLRPGEVKLLMGFVNDLGIQSEFCRPSKAAAEYFAPSVKIAAIFKKGRNKLGIQYIQRYYAGVYKIDYLRLETLRKEKQVEGKSLKELLRKLNLINTRKTVLQKILDKITEKQKKYIMTADRNQMEVYQQKELAGEMRIHPSLISRSIRGKSVEIPSGEEIMVKDFFVKQKDKIRNLIQEVIRKEWKKIEDRVISGPLKDREISQILKDEHHIFIATRTVAKYRKQLKYDSSFKRKKANKR